MGRPPAKDARDTRQSILDAALDLFADKGFFGTSMRELARAVGVRESAIYHHFANKDALLDALMIEAGNEKATRFDRAMEKLRELPVRELLTRLAHGMLEHWEEPREQRLWRMMCIEGFRLADCGRFRLDSSFRTARDRLERLFDELARAGRIKPVPARLLAMEFMAPMFLVRNVSASPQSFDLPPAFTARDILDAHVAFFCDAICPPDVQAGRG